MWLSASSGESVIMHAFRFVGQALLCLVVVLPVKLIGIPIVAWGARNPRVYPETAKPFSDPEQQPGIWMLARLSHDWMLWWDNVYDGLFGDKRGWWNTYCLEHYGKGSTSWYSMLQWAAFRNSANYFERNVIGIDVSQCVISVLAGQGLADEDNPGWSFLMAKSNDGRTRYYFSWYKALTATHGAYVRVGWKIKLSHNGTNPDADPTDRFKGFVFRASPWKAK